MRYLRALLLLALCAGLVIWQYFAAANGRQSVPSGVAGAALSPAQHGLLTVGGLVAVTAYTVALGSNGWLWFGWVVLGLITLGMIVLRSA